MSVIERAVRAYIGFAECADCESRDFKDAVKSVNRLKNNMKSMDFIIKIIKKYKLDKFLLGHDLLHALEDLKNGRDNELKLHYLLQFVREQLKGPIIYEVLNADEAVTIRNGEAPNYLKRMQYAGGYINELACAFMKPKTAVFTASALTESPVVAGRSFLDLALEYGISWDPVLDLPYIPASEIKGALRSVLLKVVLLSAKRNEYIKAALDVTGKSKGKVFLNSEFDRLKGLLNGINPEVNEYEQHVGWIRISDAYPVAAPDNRPVELMVLTPHYTPEVKKEYEVRPLPIKYIAIPAGTRISFVVSVTYEGLSALSMVLETESGKEALRDLLTAALYLGVGRRTSRGMGRMKLESLNEVTTC
ncbi:MAG: type III-B CRISPR module RAMP protein Cmr6 [Nitrososphaeria archaeon]